MSTHFHKFNEGQSSELNKQQNSFAGTENQHMTCTILQGHKNNRYLLFLCAILRHCIAIEHCNIAHKKTFVLTIRK